MYIGSTRVYNRGKSGTATFTQAQETQLSRALMKDKEEQMLMIVSSSRAVAPAYPIQL